MEKGKRFYLITIIPIIVSVIIGVILLLMHNTIGTKSKAALTVASERSQMSADIAAMRSETETLNSETEGYNKIIDENSTLINEVESLNTELESYNSDLENARQRNSELNTQITEKQEYLSSLDEVEEEDGAGTPRTLESGEYECPADLESGRYLAEGDAVIYIYNIAGSVKVREDLSTIDLHSYEFDLAEGEKLSVDGEITLTPQ